MAVVSTSPISATAPTATARMGSGRPPRKWRASASKCWAHSGAYASAPSARASAAIASHAACSNSSSASLSSSSPSSSSSASLSTTWHAASPFSSEFTTAPSPSSAAPLSAAAPTSFTVSPAISTAADTAPLSSSWLAATSQTVIALSTIAFTCGEGCPGAAAGKAATVACTMPRIARYATCRTSPWKYCAMRSTHATACSMYGIKAAPALAA
mmetsp:Transcript_14044/g.36065  ORF Transcript_14044/g.36065 Transcript_14044/m.36065 type:complete len:213 (+) Transcript_14044:622-1260(+)